MSVWLQSHPVTIAGLIAWALGILWLMPGKQVSAAKNRIPGLVLATAGIVALSSSIGAAQPEFASEVLFWLFAVGALLCGVLMITSRNPVYGALWFALVTLCTCGLFLLQQAPFLAAATIIVYAGAVIVTFLFVIMLAQQGGAMGYDQQSRQSFPATIAAFVLLGAVIMTLQIGSGKAAAVAGEGSSGATTNVTAASDAVSQTSGNPLSKPLEGQQLGTMKGLGRSLFGDYLFAVELAGTLLLIASIGAIAIAPRREQGAI
jgi:NADH-quinone oxidoreductase subunit J